MKFKTKEERDIILAGAQTIFHAVMSLEKNRQKLNRNASFSFRSGDFKLISTCVRAARKIEGCITITFKGELVWRMTHQGEYPEEALSILDNALTVALGRDEKEFVGGRGSFRYHFGDKVYCNSTPLGNFLEFKGFEEVYRGRDRLGQAIIVGGVVLV